MEVSKIPVFCIGGLENAVFLDSGSRKCLFCIGDYENAISLHRGKKCIGGQILAYFGNFLNTINPATTSRFTLFGRDRLGRARARQTSYTEVTA